MELHFKNFIINEQEDYFTKKVSAILTSVHELLQGGKQIHSLGKTHRSQFDYRSFPPAVETH